MLKGRVAVVTGASSGIGYAIAEQLAENGAKVGLLARRLDRIESLEQNIKASGGEAVAVQCDVTKQKEVFDAVDKVRERFGKIDILVNNAGVANATMISNCRVDDWLQVVDTNVIGTLHCYAAVLENMIEEKNGHIINMSSVYGRFAEAGAAGYCASKMFMQGHSAGMRQELAPLGIKVTCIQPGLVTTELNDTISDPDALTHFSSDPKLKAIHEEPTLESKDVAQSVIFALSREDRVGINEIMIEAKTSILNTV